MEKIEYIKQIKRLIKKYHPDLCKDGNMESLYNDITVKLNAILNKLKNGEDVQYITKNSDDQAYVYYKQGIQYYRNIHPGKFYKQNNDKTYETKSYEEQLDIINKIYLSFNLAEYYFNKVIEEYPGSQWKDDAKEKIKLLKKLYKSYENMDVESNKQIINSGQFVDEMGLKTMF
jgi:hypothetical protein